MHTWNSISWIVTIEMQPTLVGVRGSLSGRESQIYTCKLISRAESGGGCMSFVQNSPPPLYSSLYLWYRPQTLTLCTFYPSPTLLFNYTCRSSNIGEVALTCVLHGFLNSLWMQLLVPSHSLSTPKLLLSVTSNLSSLQQYLWF